MLQFSESTASSNCQSRRHARRLHVESLEDRRLLAPLVGVDFDATADSPPAGWVGFAPELNETGATFENIGGTEADLTIDFTGLPITVSQAIVDGSLPFDETELTELDGLVALVHVNAEFLASWSGLTGQGYEVYVFGLASDISEDFGRTNSIRITADEIGTGGHGVNFKQPVLQGGALYANDEQGDSTRPLKSFARFFRPVNGNIGISVKNSRESAVLAGLAIREIRVVDSADDIVDASDGKYTLREAVMDSNTAPGTDTIVFDSSLSGQTIALNGSEISIAGAVTIDARSLAQNVTIDAGEQSRIFDISSGGGDVVLAGLKLNAGQTTGDNVDENDNTHSGGAVRSESTGLLTIIESEITGSSTTGDNANGGAVYTTGSLSIDDSQISGNSTAGYFGYGGAFFATVGLTITDSVIENNQTTGDRGAGGAVYASGTVAISNTSLHQNSTTGNTSQGGAIYFNGDLTLIDSRVTGNHTEQAFGNGGGIRGFGSLMLERTTIDSNSTNGYRSAGPGVDVGGHVTITHSTISRNTGVGNDISGGGISAGLSLTISDSTVSGNSLTGTGTDGGGLFAGTDLTIHRSTITDNEALGSTGRGGGAIAFGDIIIDHSVLAGNRTGSQGPDLQQVFTGSLTVNYSLIGDADGLVIPGLGNIVGDSSGSGIIDPQLDALQDNGSRCQTHLPLPGSPIIDMGDPAFTDPPAYDQRGLPFDRVVNSRVDIGAVESGAVSADFDSDGDVDGYDFLQWQLGFGTSPAAVHASGDADVNGTVDGLDLDILEAAFGDIAAPLSVPIAAISTSPLESQPHKESLEAATSSQDRRRFAELVDLAIATATNKPLNEGRQSELFRDGSVNLMTASSDFAALDLSGVQQRTIARSTTSATETGTISELTFAADESLDETFADNFGRFPSIFE